MNDAVAGMSDEAAPTLLVEQLLSNAPISRNLSAEDFRDLYQTLQGTTVGRGLRWIQVFLGDQVILQPVGRRNVFLYLSRPDAEYFTTDDFGYMNAHGVTRYGSFKGRYHFRAFLREVVGFRRARVAGLSTILISLVYFTSVPLSALQAIAQALLQALAIFVTMFTLFVLEVDPDRERGYLRSGRFRRMADADKHIAFIGLLALALAVVAVAMLSSLPHRPAAPEHLLAALLMGLLTTASFGAYWLVVHYHFSRKQEMAEILMAQALLREAQETTREITEV